MSTEKEVKRFLDTFKHWASGQAEVQALALVGSFARNAAKESSDVDLVIIVRKPDRFLHDLKWIEVFGNVEKYQIEDYGLLISVRVWYADGLEIEFGLTDERWAAVPLDEGSRRVIEDGMQVLFERGPILSRHK